MLLKSSPPRQTDMAQKEPQKSADNLELDALLDGVDLDRCCFVGNYVILETVLLAVCRRFE